MKVNAKELESQAKQVQSFNEFTPVTLNAKEITEKVVEILIRHERLEPQLAILALVELKVIASVKAGENGGLLLAFDEWDQLDATRTVLHQMGGNTVEWRGWGRFLLSV